jgi:NAD dependent epimerase/dehydratase family enzyme
MRALGKVLRRPIWLPIPAFVIKLLLGEMATVLLDGQRMMPSRLLEAGFVFQHPEIHAALQDLFSRGV